MELETSFIIVADMTEEDFILGRTFIRTYEVTIDLVNRQMIIKNPNPIPVPTVPENAPESALVLEEPTEIANGQISICKLRLRDKIVKKNGCYGLV